MASKDQAIGGIILIVCAVVGILYVTTLFYPEWLMVFGVTKDWIQDVDVRFWVVAIPVLVAFVGIMAIGAWIGWTMATTPPPKPIEEITSEMEEKKEEPPAPKEEPVEEKKPERKRKEEKQP